MGNCTQINPPRANPNPPPNPAPQGDISGILTRPRTQASTTVRVPNDCVCRQPTCRCPRTPVPVQNDECVIDIGSMGVPTQFGLGVADGFVGFYESLFNAVTSPIDTMTGLWNDFRDAPFQFTGIRNTYREIRDNGVYGAGTLVGGVVGVASLGGVAYVAYKTGKCVVETARSMTGGAGAGAAAVRQVNAPKPPNAFPTTRVEVHNNLIGRGFRYISTSPEGYATYKNTQARATTTIKPTGEVINTIRLPVNPADTSPTRQLRPWRTYFDGTIIPDQSHSTGHFVEPHIP